jgi:hypothetical protein
MYEIGDELVDSNERDSIDSARTAWFDRSVRSTFTDRRAGSRELRVANLLLILREIDETVHGFVNLTESELRGLVLTAITACGFTDPAEVRLVVENVLQALEEPEAPLRYAL